MGIRPLCRRWFYDIIRKWANLLSIAGHRHLGMVRPSDKRDRRRGQRTKALPVYQATPMIEVNTFVESLLSRSHSLNFAGS